MSIGSEFKEFAIKGNVVDLAVGVIIAIVIFLAIRSINKLKKPPVGAAPAGLPRQEILLEETRDALLRR